MLHESSAESSLHYFHSAISNHLSIAISMSPKWMVAYNRFNCIQKHDLNIIKHHLKVSLSAIHLSLKFTAREGEGMTGEGVGVVEEEVGGGNTAEKRNLL